MGDAAGEFQLWSVIEFRDGGEPEGQLLHSGALKACERVQSLLPAIGYSGARKPSRAYSVIVEVEDAPGSGREEGRGGHG